MENLILLNRDLSPAARQPGSKHLGLPKVGRLKVTLRSSAHSMAADAGIMEGQPCMFPRQAIQPRFSVLESHVVLFRQTSFDSSMDLQAGTLQFSNSLCSPLFIATHGTLTCSNLVYEQMKIQIFSRNI